MPKLSNIPFFVDFNSSSPKGHDVNIRFFIFVDIELYIFSTAKMVGVLRRVSLSPSISFKMIIPFCSLVWMYVMKF